MRLRAVIDDVYVIVAHALHTGNDQAAQDVARDLARELGTQSTTLAGGMRPARAWSAKVRAARPRRCRTTGRSRRTTAPGRRPRTPAHRRRGGGGV
ncbi:hypothetical protein K7G98_17985 [Saccharothrix sp. MB29]|nr:hypothetical protein [Saccharothrix sp. MB29]